MDNISKIASNSLNLARNAVNLDTDSDKYLLTTFYNYFSSYFTLDKIYKNKNDEFLMQNLYNNIYDFFISNLPYGFFNYKEYSKFFIEYKVFILKSLMNSEEYFLYSLICVKVVLFFLFLFGFYQCLFAINMSYNDNVKSSDQKNEFARSLIQQMPVADLAYNNNHKNLTQYVMHQYRTRSAIQEKSEDYFTEKNYVHRDAKGIEEVDKVLTEGYLTAGDDFYKEQVALALAQRNVVGLADPLDKNAMDTLKKIKSYAKNRVKELDKILDSNKLYSTQVEQLVINFTKMGALFFVCTFYEGLFYFAYSYFQREETLYYYSFVILLIFVFLSILLKIHKCRISYAKSKDFMYGGFIVFFLKSLVLAYFFILMPTPVFCYLYLHFFLYDLFLVKIEEESLKVNYDLDEKEKINVIYR